MARTSTVKGRGRRVRGRAVKTGPRVIEDVEEQSPIVDYGGDTAAFSVVTSPVYQGSQALKGDGSDSVITTSDVTVRQGDNLDSRIRFPTTDDNLGVVYGAQAVTGKANLDAYAMHIVNAGDRIIINKLSGGSETLIADQSGFGSIADAYLRPKLDWATDGTQTLTVYDDTGSQHGQVSATDTTYTSGYTGFWTQVGEASYYDAYRRL